MMPTDSRIAIDENAFGEPFSGVALIVGTFDPTILPNLLEQSELGSGAFIGNRTILTAQHVTENLQEARVVIGAGMVAIPQVLGSFEGTENGAFRDILGTDDIGLITINNPNVVAAAGPEPALVFGMDVFMDPQNFIDNFGPVPVVHAGFPNDGLTGDISRFRFETVTAQMFGVTGEIDEIRDFGSARLASDTNFIVGPDADGNGTFDVSFENGADGTLDGSQGQSGGPLLTFDAESSQWRAMGIASQAFQGVSTVFELIKLDSFERISDIMSSTGDSLPDGVSNRITGLIGNTFRERIEGSDFADTIRSMGAADGVTDLLFGGVGNDVYEFAHFYSDVGILEASVADGANPGFDALHFPELNRSDILLARAGDQHLYVNFIDPSSGGSELTVTITNHFAGRPVEEIRLADGIIPLTAGLQLFGTELADNFGGTGFDDTLIGLSGNDVLTGLGGDDTVIGGDGSDNLQGGTGSDIYILESGLGDVIVDAEGDRDQVILAGLNIDDVRLIRPDATGLLGFSLQIVEKSTGNLAEENAARINAQFTEAGQIETLIFENGEELDLTGGLPFTGSEDRNDLRGTEFDDQFFGEGNRDFIDAGAGNDWIVGGTGDDVLAGGSGNDTYVFSPGDGQDGINEAADGGTEDTILLQDFNPALLEIEDFGSFLLLRLGADGIRVNKGVNDSSPIESIIFADGGGVDLSLSGALENAIPVGGTDSFDAVSASETLTVLVDDLLSNDTDPDANAALQLVGLQQGTGGTAGIADDSLIFVPDPSFVGTATFTYLLSDGFATVPVAVSIDVGPALPTDGNDIVFGTSGSDILDAMSGNDFVSPLSGNDSVDGGDGNDTLSFALLEDPEFNLNGQPIGVAVDLGRQGIAQETGRGIATFENFENLEGSDFGDVLSGDAGANILTGLAGNDTLNGRAGNDTLDGGLGNDRFFVDSVDDVVIEAAGEGTDLITTSVDFTLAENVENASSSGSADIEITGNAGANFMSGNGGDNRLVGLAGADRLRGGAGNDTLEGGQDNDILEGQGGADRFVMTANNGDDQIIGWEASTDILDFEALDLRFADLRLTSSGSEALITFDDPAGGSGSVRLIDIDPEVLEIGIMSDPGGIPLVAGTSASENLAGSAAGDDLIGLAGSDTLNGRAGDDTMLGGFGDDRYLLDDAGDIALELEFQGIDQVDTRFDLVLGANIERAAVRGGGAVDITGNELDNFITGSDLQNVLIGGDGRDRLIARAGNDTLDGGLDRDVLEGGAGEDVFVFGADSDVDLITDFVVGEDLIDVSALGIAFADMTIVDGALGALVIFDAAPGSVDLVTLQGVSAADVRLASFIGAPNLPIIGTAGDDVLRGTVEDDELQGLGGADRLDGLSGADTLIGGPGDDRYFIDDAGDVVTELAGEGTDLVSSLVDFTLPEHVENGSALGTGDVDLTGNGLANALTGNDASNVLTGLDGDDNLQGKAGADTIDGGAGFDVLRGGADADVFVFAPGDGATGDQIIDFEVGVDTIDLSATGLGFGDLTIVDVGANALVTYGMNTLTVFNTTAAELDSGQFEF